MSTKQKGWIARALAVLLVAIVVATAPNAVVAAVLTHLFCATIWALIRAE